MVERKQAPAARQFVSQGMRFISNLTQSFRRSALLLSSFVPHVTDVCGFSLPPNSNMAIRALTDGFRALHAAPTGGNASDLLA
jgi:hypothetical protein